MLIDSHCHLDFTDFTQELDDIVERARTSGVGRMVTISTKVSQFDRLKTICETYDDVYCSTGTHPCSTHEEPDITTDQLIEICQHPKVIAIGETGLDYHYDYSTPQQQLKCFIEHINAARETQLPLVIHARDADDDIADILRKETNKGSFPFILHCFSSGRKLAEAGIELGGYISFSGILTFKSAQTIRDIATIVPHNRLLVETDAPYLAPVPYRGKRNEPSYVVHTADVLAQTIGLSEDEIAKITTENAFKIFNKMH